MKNTANESVHLIHHMANRDHLFPPNSIRGLQACLDSHSRHIELDISPTADDQFVILHGSQLDHETNGSGPVCSLNANEITKLHLTQHGTPTPERVGLLSQAVERIARHAFPVELQLDLKIHKYLDNRLLSNLLATLQHIKDRVRITSTADWSLRRLRELDPDIQLGFDPMLYLDSRSSNDPCIPKPQNTARPPFRLGAFGYWDDHPLATQRWGNTADYLWARSEALWAQAPAGATWYLHAELLDQALDDGFDWIARLHDRGAEVTAWTLDAERPEHVAMARRLIATGIDRITTNAAPSLAEALGDGICF